MHIYIYIYIYVQKPGQFKIRLKIEFYIVEISIKKDIIYIYKLSEYVYKNIPLSSRLIFTLCN